MAPSGKPADVRASVENCIKQLKGTKKIDIFESARVDKHTPIEETMGEFKKLVEEGKIGGIGLSEVSADTVRRAAKIAPIAAVETEVSLFEDQAFAKGVASTCAELKIPIIGYSPLGRGFLTGQVNTPEDLNPIQQRFPRYQGENFEKNLELVRKVEAIAKKHGATPAQFSIAWVAAQGKKTGLTYLLPLPGATTKERVKENMEIKKFKDEDFAEIDDFLKTFTAAGHRYPAAGQAHLET